MMKIDLRASAVYILFHIYPYFELAFIFIFSFFILMWFVLVMYGAFLVVFGLFIFSCNLYLLTMKTSTYFSSFQRHF